MATQPIASFFKKTDCSSASDCFPKADSPAKMSMKKAVERELEREMSPVASPGSRKRKRYGNYSPEQRAKIARYAISHGNTAAARHVTKETGETLNESTVRGMKTAYEKTKKRQGSIQDVITSLPRSPRGRPLKIGEYDGAVCEYIRNLRAAGGVVNSRIVLAAARGLIQHENRTLLAEFGGHITLEKPWATSILRRLNFVKRKGTKGVKHLPEDFDVIQSGFLKRIDDVVTKHSIPDSLIINWDQTGSNYVPISDWTMAAEGSKQVAISSLDDKRQMTALLACTKSGELLPTQLIYSGKTDACHASYKFPDEWDIAHTESHWSASESMIRYVKNVIFPYIEKLIDEQDLPLRQHALCVFDIYKAHRGEPLLELLASRNVHVVFVPASCTDRLQPLDLGINGPFKQLMKSQFQQFYADAVAEQLKNTTIDKVHVDLKLSVVKPLHAKWITSALNDMSKKCDLIKNAWVMAGVAKK